MDLGSALVGLGGLVVAGLSLWLNYKERASSHREMIYARQMEAYNSVLRALWDFEDAVSAHMPADSETWKDSEKAKLLDGVRNAYADIYRVLRENALYCSKPVVDKVNEACQRMPRSVSDHDWPSGVELVDQLQDGILDVLVAARIALGTAPLSHEILRVVGTADTQSKKKR